MTRFASRLACSLRLLLVPLLGWAEDGVQKVHVIERIQCGTVVEIVSDTIRETGTPYTPTSPPVKAGYRFGYWTGYPTAEDRIAGDFWTYPATPTITVYGEMTLTAHYVEEGADSDGDGISDWDEVSWHVEDLASTSDEDADGYTLKQELANGTNPWCRDQSKTDGIGYADTSLIVYNPNRLPTCVIRSNPEGLLFDTISNTCVVVGTAVTTPTLDPFTSTFAYWAVNGVRQTDEHGVALRSVTFQMPHANVLVIAETEEIETERLKLYYYGMGMGEDSDTDGDGSVFSQEVAQGTNPLFVDQTVEAGIGYADSGPIAYNPHNLCSYVIRSEPEGALFDTQIGEYVASGTTITSPTCDPQTSKFAYWSLNGVRQTDAYGVALRQVTACITNQDVELVAVTEEDDVARLQYYWYGECFANDIDTDGDGYRFSQEMVQGSNPQFADLTVEAGIGYADSGLIAYNPKNLHNYLVLSDPEGVLFDTIAALYVPAGTVVTTPDCDAVNTKFAYWMLNGIRQCDDYGVSLTMVTTTMTSEDIELVAVTIDDERERKSYYWFGESRVLTEDADGDGYDLAAEIAQGTNPRFQDGSRGGGISYADSGLIDYNPKNLHSYVIRSDPEGGLFETIQANSVALGTRLATPMCDTKTTAFAYWTVNGVRQCDAYGVAFDSLDLTMGTEDLEIVAVTSTDEQTRQFLYWYGPEAITVADSDGDGYDLKMERTQGTSPVFSNATLKAGIECADTLLIDYNPGSCPTCVIRSEPDGVLFATITKRYVQPGTWIKTPFGAADDETFACWKMNGVVQRDVHGRALNSVNFTMPDGDVELVAVSCSNALDRARLYWYGSEEPLPVDDTDGDGFGLADEVAAGTSPTFKNTIEQGGIGFADTDVFEINLQPYERANGVVVGGKFENVFGGWNFGHNVNPIVCDITGDGLFDLVIKSDSAVRCFINTGKKNNPQFREATNADLSLVDFMTNDVSRLAGVVTDVEPVNPQSCTWGDVDGDGRVDLLVSDTEGRIWYYRNVGIGYQLKHKVWGGSYAGFADGLRISAVDWEDDGDFDCICGTADGKLMLLRDPKVGRPANLYALAGVDNALLEWDPNAQSRIRGYNVYRSAADVGDYRKLNSEYVQLPAYRDYPPTILDYDYKVTSVSRFYQAGNSTPIVSESPATDSIRVELGKVTLVLNDAAGFIGREVEVPVSINNSLNLSGTGLELSVAFDRSVLKPKEVKTSTLTENLSLTQNIGTGTWSVRGTGGTVAPGTGVMLTLVFRVSEEADEGDTDIEVISAKFKSTANEDVSVPTLVLGVVSLEAYDPPDSSYVPFYGRGDIDGDGRLGWNDVELMLQWKDCRVQDLSDEAIRAGDYNGDGVLDNRDYPLMRKDFRTREAAGGDMKGWDRNHTNGGKRR